MPASEDRRPAPLRHWLLLLAVLLFAAWLRTVAIGREALWTDEALTLPIAHWPVGEMLAQPTDPTPPLYYLLHKLLLTGAKDVVAIRSLSLVAGLMSVFAIYVLARLAHGWRAGVLAAALLAVWAPHVDYSQEARAYSLLFLMTLMSAIGLLWWFRATAAPYGGPALPRRAALALFAVATSLCFYTHIVAVFWIAVALQIFLSRTLQTRRLQREMLVTMGVMALLAAPGTLRMVRQLLIPHNFHWLEQASPTAFATTSLDVLLPLGTAGFVRAVLALAVVATFGILTWRLQRWARPMPIETLIAGAFLALPCLVWLFGFVGPPFFMTRTVLYAVPGVILLLSSMVVRIGSSAGQATATAGLVGTLVWGTAAGGFARAKEHWRGLEVALAHVLRPGDVLIVCPAWKYPALRHARTAPSGVPIVSESGALLEPDFGADPQWSQEYFDQELAPPVRFVTQGVPIAPQPSANVSVALGGSEWVVLSECDADSERRLTAGAEQIWSSAPVDDVAGIRLLRRTPAAGTR